MGPSSQCTPHQTHAQILHTIALIPIPIDARLVKVSEVLHHSPLLHQLQIFGLVSSLSHFSRGKKECARI